MNSSIQCSLLLQWVWVVCFFFFLLEGLWQMCPFQCFVMFGVLIERKWRFFWTVFVDEYFNFFPGKTWTCLFPLFKLAIKLCISCFFFCILPHHYIIYWHCYFSIRYLYTVRKKSFLLSFFFFVSCFYSFLGFYRALSTSLAGSAKCIASIIGADDPGCQTATVTWWMALWLFLAVDG